MSSCTHFKGRSGLLRLVAVKGRESFEDCKESAEHSGAPQDENILLSSIFHYFLNFTQQRLHKRVLNGLRS